MTLWQAILCGLFYYLNAAPWIMGAGLFTFGRPLVLGFLVGLVLGDPVTGTTIGAAIQLIYLGILTTGGSYPADAALAGIIGTAVAITSGISPTEAVAIAVPVGLAGTVLNQLKKLTAVPFTHMADRYAAEGKANKIVFANVVFPQIAVAALYMIPCTLACYFGVNAISDTVNYLAGSVILSILSVIGGVLPVIGISMNMKAIFKGDARAFFFVGFILVVYLKLDLIAISAFALISAIIYVQLKSEPVKEV